MVYPTIDMSTIYSGALSFVNFVLPVLLALLGITAGGVVVGKLWGVIKSRM